MNLNGSTMNVRGLKLTVAAITACVLLADGSARAALIGHWTFDEGTGTTAADYSGNGNTATLAGVAGSWITGQIGSAYQLGGTTSRFELADSTDLQVTGAVSVAAWVKSWAASSFGVIAGIDASGGTTNDMYTLKTTTNDNLNWSVIGPGGAVNLISTKKLLGVGGLSEGDVWVHVVGVYDPSGFAALYINGLLDVSTTSVPSSIQSKTTPFQMGHNAGDSGTTPFKGAIDDVRVYSHALSAQEVADLFAGTQVPTPAALPVGLVLMGLIAARGRRRRR